MFQDVRLTVGAAEAAGASKAYGLSGLGPGRAARPRQAVDGCWAPREYATIASLAFSMKLPNTPSTRLYAMRFSSESALLSLDRTSSVLKPDEIA